jgi:hypothetical protein
MGNPFHRGPYAYGGQVPDPTLNVGAVIEIDDGVTTVVEPDWFQVSVGSVLGAAGHADAGDAVVDVAATYLWEFRVAVKHVYDQYLIFGMQVDDGDIQEIGRVQIRSDDFMFVISDRHFSIALEEGQRIKYFISSSFEWQYFEWRNFEVMAVTEALLGPAQ